MRLLLAALGRRILLVSRCCRTRASALAHVRVGDQRGHVQCGERDEIRFTTVARVRGEYRRARAERGERLDFTSAELRFKFSWSKGSLYAAA